MTVSRAKREIDSIEFAYWMAYFNIEPFGERLADIRMGMIASTVANSQRDPACRAFEPIDFMPWANTPPQPIEFPDKEDQAAFVAMAVFGVDLNRYRGKERRSGAQRESNG